MPFSQSVNLSFAFSPFSFLRALTLPTTVQMVALYNLATPAHLMCKQYDLYVIKLESAPSPTAKVTFGNLHSFRGVRQNFAGLCNFFEEQERGLGGIEELVAGHCPRLMVGCAGALMHGIIHLGWAIAVGHRWMAIEGVAYLTFSYLDVPGRQHSYPSRPDELDPIASLLHIAEQWETLGLQMWVREVDERPEYQAQAGFHPELADTGFQYRLAKVMAEGHEIIQGRPGWLLYSNTLPNSCFWEELYFAMALLYLAMPGDFFVLHAVTSLWGLDHIAALLPGNVRISAIKYWWSTAVAITLVTATNLPSVHEITDMRREFAQMFDDVYHEEWTSMIERARTAREEHNTKLIMVLHDVYQRYRHRTIFRLAARQIIQPIKLDVSDLQEAATAQTQIGVQASVAAAYNTEPSTMEASKKTD